MSMLYITIKKKKNNDDELYLYFLYKIFNK